MAKYFYQLSPAGPLPEVREGAHNHGMCPDKELNQQTFGAQYETHPLSHTSQDLNKFLKVCITIGQGMRGLRIPNCETSLTAFRIES